MKKTSLLKRSGRSAKKEGGLEEWIKQAEAAAGNPFKSFLTGVRRDYAAVEKAFTSPWNNEFGNL
jgi:transposase